LPIAYARNPADSRCGRPLSSRYPLAIPERYRLNISPTPAPFYTHTCFAIFWGRQDAVQAAIASILVAHEKTLIAVPVWNGRRHLGVLRR